MAFLSNREESRTPEGDVARLDNCKPELNDAVTSITDKVKQLIMNGSANHLPISAVAYTILPQLLAQLNLQLASTDSEKRRNERIVRFYSELDRLYNLRFDTAHVSSCIQKLLQVFNSIKSDPTIWATKTAQPGNQVNTHQSTALIPTKSFSDIFKKRPAIYLRMANILDFSLSTGEALLHFNIKSIDVDLDGFTLRPRDDFTNIHPLKLTPNLPLVDPMAFNMFSNFRPHVYTMTTNANAASRSPLSLTLTQASPVASSGGTNASGDYPTDDEIRDSQDMNTDLMTTIGTNHSNIGEKDKIGSGDNSGGNNLFDWVLSDLALYGE